MIDRNKGISFSEIRQAWRPAAGIPSTYGDDVADVPVGAIFNQFDFVGGYFDIDIDFVSREVILYPDVEDRIKDEIYIAKIDELTIDSEDAGAMTLPELIAALKPYACPSNIHQNRFEGSHINDIAAGGGIRLTYNSDRGIYTISTNLNDRVKSLELKGDTYKIKDIRPIPTSPSNWRTTHTKWKREGFTTSSGLEVYYDPSDEIMYMNAIGGGGGGSWGTITGNVWDQTTENWDGNPTTMLPSDSWNKFIHRGTNIGFGNDEVAAPLNWYAELCMTDRWDMSTFPKASVWLMAGSVIVRGASSVNDITSAYLGIEGSSSWRVRLMIGDPAIGTWTDKGKYEVRDSNATSLRRTKTLHSGLTGVTSSSVLAYFDLSDQFSTSADTLARVEIITDDETTTWSSVSTLTPVSARKVNYLHSLLLTVESGLDVYYPTFTDAAALIAGVPVDDRDTKKIYLVGPADGPFHEYLWEGLQWTAITDFIEIGTTDITMSNYYTQTQIDNTLANYYTKTQTDSAITTALSTYEVKKLAEGTNITINESPSGTFTISASTGGLAEVAHDDTLTGKGTTADTLKVNVAKVVDGIVASDTISETITERIIETITDNTDIAEGLYDAIEPNIAADYKVKSFQDTTTVTWAETATGSGIWQATATGGSGSAVTSIIAGTGISVSPSTGTGDVTITNTVTDTNTTIASADSSVTITDTGTGGNHIYDLSVSGGSSSVNWSQIGSISSGDWAWEQVFDGPTGGKRYSIISTGDDTDFSGGTTMMIGQISLTNSTTGFKENDHQIWMQGTHYDYSTGQHRNYYRQMTSMPLYYGDDFHNEEVLSTYDFDNTQFGIHGQDDATPTTNAQFAKVYYKGGSGGSSTWGSITGTISSQTDLWGMLTAGSGIILTPNTTTGTIAIATDGSGGANWGNIAEYTSNVFNVDYPTQGYSRNESIWKTVDTSSTYMDGKMRLEIAGKIGGHQDETTGYWTNYQQKTSLLIGDVYMNDYNIWAAPGYLPSTAIMVYNISSYSGGTDDDPTQTDEGCRVLTSFPLNSDYKYNPDTGKYEYFWSKSHKMKVVLCANDFDEGYFELNEETWKITPLGAPLGFAVRSNPGYSSIETGRWIYNLYGPSDIYRSIRSAIWSNADDQSVNPTPEAYKYYHDFLNMGPLSRASKGYIFRPGFPYYATKNEVLASYECLGPLGDGTDNYVKKRVLSANPLLYQAAPNYILADPEMVVSVGDFGDSFVVDQCFEGGTVDQYWYNPCLGKLGWSSLKPNYTNFSRTVDADGEVIDGRVTRQGDITLYEDGTDGAYGIVNRTQLSYYGLSLEMNDPSLCNYFPIATPGIHMRAAYTIDRFSAFYEFYDASNGAVHVGNRWMHGSSRLEFNAQCYDRDSSSNTYYFRVGSDMISYKEDPDDPSTVSYTYDEFSYDNYGSLTFNVRDGLIIERGIDHTWREQNPDVAELMIPYTHIKFQGTIPYGTLQYYEDMYKIGPTPEHWGPNTANVWWGGIQVITTAVLDTNAFALNNDRKLTTIAPPGSAVWGSIAGTLEDQEDLYTRVLYDQEGDYTKFLPGWGNYTYEPLYVAPSIHNIRILPTTTPTELSDSNYIIYSYFSFRSSSGRFNGSVQIGLETDSASGDSIMVLNASCNISKNDGSYDYVSFWGKTIATWDSTNNIWVVDPNWFTHNPDADHDTYLAIFSEETDYQTGDQYLSFYFNGSMENTDEATLSSGCLYAQEFPLTSDIKEVYSLLYRLNLYIRDVVESLSSMDHYYATKCLWPIPLIYNSPDAVAIDTDDSTADLSGYKTLMFNLTPNLTQLSTDIIDQEGWTDTVVELFSVYATVYSDYSGTIQYNLGLIAIVNAASSTITYKWSVKQNTSTWDPNDYNNKKYATAKWNTDYSYWDINGTSSGGMIQTLNSDDVALILPEGYSEYVVIGRPDPNYLGSLYSIDSIYVNSLYADSVFQNLLGGTYKAFSNNVKIGRYSPWSAPSNMDLEDVMKDSFSTDLIHSSEIKHLHEYKANKIIMPGVEHSYEAIEATTVNRESGKAILFNFAYSESELVPIAICDALQQYYVNSMTYAAIAHVAGDPETTGFSNSVAIVVSRNTVAGLHVYTFYLINEMSYEGEELFTLSKSSGTGNYGIIDYINFSNDFTSVWGSMSAHSTNIITSTIEGTTELGQRECNRIEFSFKTSGGANSMNAYIDSNVLPSYSDLLGLFSSPNYPSVQAGHIYAYGLDATPDIMYDYSDIMDCPELIIGNFNPSEFEIDTTTNQIKLATSENRQIRELRNEIRELRKEIENLKERK